MDPRERSGDDQLAFLAALDGRQARLWTALPGLIQDFSAAEMTVSVQPTIMGVFTNPDGTKQAIQLPKLIHCPVMFPSGGGFTLTFPIKIGDECLVVFASRCIDAWWKAGGVQPQDKIRMHDLSDGFAIPGFRSVPRVLASISSQGAMLRTDDIADQAAFIHVKDNNCIDIIATGETGLQITANAGGVFISGDLRVTGKVTAGKEVTSLLGGTHTLTQHVHTVPGTNMPTG